MKKLGKITEFIEYTATRRVDSSLLPNDLEAAVHHAADGPLNDFYEQHERFCFMLCLEGTLRIRVCRRLFSLKGGESFLVFPYQSHLYDSISADGAVLFVLFSVKSNAWLARLSLQVNRENAAFAALASSLPQRWNRTAAPEMDTLFLSCHLVSYFREALRVTKPSAIDCWLLERPPSAWFAAELARGVGVSPAWLNRLARSTMDCAIGDYLRELRLNCAVQLLLESSLPVKEIAATLGFGSISHFIYLFKGVYGQTPRSFRARWRGKPHFQIKYTLAPGGARAIFFSLY